MTYDHEAVGFTVELIARGPDPRGMRLDGHAGTTQVVLSDPSGAGHRWVLDQDGDEICDEPLLRTGPVSSVQVVDVVRDDDCTWCSVLLADVTSPDGTTRLAFTVPDLPSSLSAWHPGSPAPAWLSLWPHHIRSYSTRTSFDARPPGSVPLGSWTNPTPDGTEPVLTTVAGRVTALTTHVNVHTGAQFGVAVVDAGPGRPSVCVPFTAPELTVTRLALDHLLVVTGQLRASYAGPVSRTVVPAGRTSWLALRLGLVAPALSVPVPASAPPPPPAPACFGPERTGRGLGPALSDDITAGAAAGPGVAACVAGDDREPVLTGYSVLGESWKVTLPSLSCGLRTGDGLVLALSGGAVHVVEARSGQVLLRMTLPDPPVRWVVSRHGLWALTGEPKDPSRRWSLLRLPRSRWSTDGTAFLEVCDRVDLPHATGTGPGYHRATLEPGDTALTSAVVIVPDDDRPGVLVKAPPHGPVATYRPDAARLPFGVLATPSGELVTTAGGAWLDGRPLADLTLPLQRHTRWWPLDEHTVAGEIVPAYEHADEMPPSRTGILDLGGEGPVWTEVERTHFLSDVRWASDPHSPHTAWWSAHSPGGTRVGRIDLRVGTTSHVDLDVSASLLAADTRQDAACVLVHPPSQRVYAPGGAHVASSVPPSTTHVLEVRAP